MVPHVSKPPDPAPADDIAQQTTVDLQATVNCFNDRAAICQTPL